MLIGIFISMFEFFNCIYLKTNLMGVVTTDENYRLWPERSNQSRIPTEGKHTVRDVLTAPNLLPGVELAVKTSFAGIETQ